MPLVVAIVGIGGTYSVTQAQNEHTRSQSLTQQRASEALVQAELEAAAARAEADREIQLLEVFGRRIFEKESDRRTAIALLRAINPSLGQRIARAIADQESELPAIRDLARSIGEELAQTTRFRVSFEGIDVKEDGAWGSATWSFRISANGVALPSLSYGSKSFNDRKDAILVSREATYRTSEPSLRLDVQGVGPLGRVAVGQAVVERTEEGWPSEPLDVPVAVPGNEWLGDFVVRLEATEVVATPPEVAEDPS